MSKKQEKTPKAIDLNSLEPKEVLEIALTTALTFACILAKTPQPVVEGHNQALFLLERITDKQGPN